VKTAEQAAVYGGTAGEAYDPSYHEALDQFSDAAAHATINFASDETPLTGATRAKAKPSCKVYQTYEGPEARG
jgi:hypothetical protein